VCVSIYIYTYMYIYMYIHIYKHLYMAYHSIHIPEWQMRQFAFTLTRTCTRAMLLCTLSDRPFPDTHVCTHVRIHTHTHSRPHTLAHQSGDCNEDTGRSCMTTYFNRCMCMRVSYERIICMCNVVVVYVTVVSVCVSHMCV